MTDLTAHPSRPPNRYLGSIPNSCVNRSSLLAAPVDRVLLCWSEEVMIDKLVLLGGGAELGRAVAVIRVRVLQPLRQKWF